MSPEFMAFIEGILIGVVGTTSVIALATWLA